MATQSANYPRVTFGSDSNRSLARLNYQPLAFCDPTRRLLSKRCDSAAGTDAGISASPAADDLPERATARRILIAEDNRINQIVVDRFLKSHGHSTVIVDNGRKALGLLESESFDLLVTDIQMPEMDGYELVAALRSREKHTGNRLPVIGLTAQACAEDRKKCLAVGMDVYLSKPIAPQELHRTVDALTLLAPAGHSR